MAKFVIHKKGFFYNDDSYEGVNEPYGSIVKTYATIEEAEKAKIEEDIKSLNNLKGYRINEFFPYDENYKKVEEEYKKYCSEKFNLTFSDKYECNLPNAFDDKQAREILKILDISFNQIVEYSDDEILDPKEFSERMYDDSVEF